MSHKQVKARLITGLALLCTGVIFGLILFAVQSNFSNDKAYAQNLIRLHVIAHSNAPADQDLKLVVRDAVLQEAEQILGEAGEKDQAYWLLTNNQSRLEKRAQEVVFEQGFCYPVQVKMGQFVFPYREYGSMSLTEGWYDAVRIEIGQAEGDNWWCVLFPPLCLAELEGAEKNLATIDRDKVSGHRFVFRLKFWENVANTRYAKAIQKWWQASAAGFPTLSN